MLPASGGEKPSAAGETRFASPATMERSRRERDHAVELLAVAVDVEVDDGDAFELGGVGDAA